MLRFARRKRHPAHVLFTASGLNHSCVGSGHKLLKDMRKIYSDGIRDKAAINAFFKLSRLEGIIAALESAHAVVYVLKLAKEQR